MSNKNKKQINNFVPELDELTDCMIKMNAFERATYNLYEAIAANNTKTAEKAIKNGANVNAHNKPCVTGGGTPLDSAAYWSNTYGCSLDMIKLLRRHGATDYNLERVKFLEEAKKCRLVKPIQKKKIKKL